MRMNKKAKSKIFHYNFFSKNRRGEKVISVYWFAILFIVAAAVVYMVFIFYGQPYDVREIEADMLTSRISDCLSEGGYLIKENLVTDNFLQNCNLNFNTEDSYGWGEQEQYYFKAEVKNFADGVLIFDVAKGNPNLKDFCGKEDSSFPACVETEVYSVDKEGNQYEIKILSVVRKTEKNVN